MPKVNATAIVSIIVPIYNVEDYVEKCIDSILSQTYDNMEIILVNDGSTDNSRNLINKYIKDTRCKIIDKENGGLSSARNAGIKVATGKYLYFIDSDDYILPNTIEKLVNVMEKENSDFCCFGIVFFNNNYKRFINTGFNVPYIIGNENIMEDALLGKRIKNTAWSKFFNTNFIKQHNLYFYEGIINEDYLFTIQCCIYSNKVSFLDENLYMAYIRENSISRDIKVENLTSYFTIDEVLKKELFEYRNMGHLKGLYDASYTKNILYGLLQCVYKSSSYDKFSLLYNHLNGSEYLNTDRGDNIKDLGMKFYILYKISLHKKFFYIIGKLMKNMGYYMP